MSVAPPVKTASRPPLSRALLVTMSVLGIIALAQGGSLLWQLATRPVEKPQAESATSPPTPAPTPTAAAKSAATQEAEAAALAAEAELAAAEAERQFVAKKAEEQLVSVIPRPTPLPSAQTTSPQEMQVNGLVQLARTLRDRGDTATALTRLREAQVLSPENPLVISEMAMIYEKMGLQQKALDQWRRIVDFGEKAGIYYAAAEAKLRAAELAIATPALTEDEIGGSLIPQDFNYRPPVLSLNQPGTVEDTGNSQPLRKFRLRVPVKALPGLPVDAEQVVIQVYFYDRLQDGSLVETTAQVDYRWLARRLPDGSEAPIDWSSGQPEVLEVTYEQTGEEPEADGRFQTGRRNYFGYVVHVYYKGQLNATHSDPARLLTEFPAPLTLQPSDDLPE